MKLRLRFIVVLGLGIVPVAGLFAASSVPAKSLGWQWAAQWLGKARLKYNPTQPVNLNPNPTRPTPDSRSTTPRLEKPFVTGPMALLVNLSAIQPLPPKNASTFKYWIKFEASEAMRQRYQKIMLDLAEYYQTRGYSEIRARLMAEDLFHAKASIYYPLVHHGSPNLGGLKAGQTRNPYSGETLANSAADNYNLGIICQKVGNFKQAAQLYHQAAVTGHARAQASLAYLYESGQGVPQSAVQAVALYTAAARQGHAVAQYNLGRIYQNGLYQGKSSIPLNLEKAEFHLQNAATQGIISAYHQLGVLYYNLGTQLTANSLDEKVFQEWDTNGDKIISKTENRYLHNAHDHFLLAAQQQHGPALHALGVMYLQGYGVQPDPVKAVYYLEQAISHPQPDSYYNLAQLYEAGNGTNPNLARAFMLYRKAARMGHSPSQYNIGLFYYQGRKAGALVSMKIPEAFANKYSEAQIVPKMVSIDPKQNAILAEATASYRSRDPNSPLRTLDIYVAEEHAQFAIEALRKILPKDGLNPNPTITPLGGDDPVQASAWWTLAAEQKQPAAQQALALVNRVLTPEQAHVAKAIASTEKAHMRLPSSQPPIRVKADSRAFKITDWGTGFFVSQDGYVIAGKHLLQSGNRFNIVTENGSFPAKPIPASGDLNHYLLMKVQGDYDFPSLSINSSHSTRLRDPVKVLGFQMNGPNSGGQPSAAQAITHVQGILGAEADPRFFTLASPVLGDQLTIEFERYLDDQQTLNQEFTATPKTLLHLIKLHSITLERLNGILRTTSPLLSSIDLSIGYQLKVDLLYDGVSHQWLSEPDKQNRARLFTAGSWITLDNRTIQSVPPFSKIEQNQALLRLSVMPGVVSDGKEMKRIYQLAENALTQPVSGKKASTQLEKFALDAQFAVVKRTSGFRGAALMNSQGQAIGLFFPNIQNRSPDVFRNFSSYHRYILKSDHLLAFLNRAPDVQYETAAPEIPQFVATDSTSLQSDAYLLAKAQASMVLVEVWMEPKGGDTP